MSIDISTLTREEKSILLYAETCIVDRSGLLCGARMNEADIAALKKLEADGALTFGRIPFRLIPKAEAGFFDTHWVTFNEPAWQAAHALRRVAAQRVGPKRRAINEALAERAEA